MSRAYGLRIAAAFAVIYLVWGSTFLAIRLAVETIPPLSMMALRCLVAGAILALWAGVRPTAAQLRGAALTGSLFFLGCHGVVAAVQQRVPSGIAALFMATIPLWVPLLGHLAGRAAPPRPLALLGLGGGLAGVGLLLAGKGVDAHLLTFADGLLLLAAALAWAAATVAGRHLELPPGAAATAGWQLLCGGLLLSLAALLLGETADFAMPSLASAGGLAYLIVFGTLLGFSCFAWLVARVPAAMVSTYAFVNPPIAVLLGWLLVGEPLTLGMGVATALIAGSVALSLWALSRPATPPQAARSA
ncbi:MAG: drug/metabolite exporter YedA [Thalassobaculales bacterium]